MEMRALPATRRGHSMVSLFGYVYLFGGLSDGYSCSYGIRDVCRLHNGTLNDLWRLDPVTNTWTHLYTIGMVDSTTSDPWLMPDKREQHSAVVINEYNVMKMAIFGGRSPTIEEDGNIQMTYFNDLWEMDPGYVTDFTIVGDRGIKVPLKDGRVVFSVAEVNSATLGLVARRRMQAEQTAQVVSEKSRRLAATEPETTLLDPDEFSKFLYPGDDEKLCLIDVDVFVNLTHSCTNQLEIVLYGPGPDHVGARTSGETYSHRYHNTISHRQSVKLFSHHSGVDSIAGCGGNIEGATFDDDAINGVYEGAFSPFAGIFRPIDKLDVFNGIPVNGDWTIAIYDKEVDGIEGILHEWSLTFVMERCSPSYPWLEVYVAPWSRLPSPRYGHVAVPYGTSIFIFGGQNDRILDDLWRFDYFDREYREIDVAPFGAMHTMARYGQALLVTPWAILSHGGLHSRWDAGVPAPSTLDSCLWSLDPEVAKWMRVETSGDCSNRRLAVESHRSPVNRARIDLFDQLPSARYLHSMVLVGNDGSFSRSRGVREAKVLLFGGYDGSKFLDDLWELNIRDLAPNHGAGTYFNATGVATEARIWQARCEWKFDQGGTENQRWSQSCGHGGLQVQDCSLDDILLQSWCQYGHEELVNPQSFQENAGPGA